MSSASALKSVRESRSAGLNYSQNPDFDNSQYLKSSSAQSQTSTVNKIPSKPAMCSVSIQTDPDVGIQTDSYLPFSATNVVALVTEVLFYCVKISKRADVVEFITDCAERHFGSGIVKSCD